MMINDYTVLVFIRNLADVSNDNLLDVHEFVLAMHLVHGVLQGKKLPKTLPRSLSIPNSKPEKLDMTAKEKEAYTNLFDALDSAKKGYIEGNFYNEEYTFVY